MGRRKIPRVVQLLSGGTYEGWSSANLCTWEFLQQSGFRIPSDDSPPQHGVMSIFRIFTISSDAYTIWSA